MKVPYISVAVPVYNAEKAIERCVNSISGQSFRDLEILLIDDGSKDASGGICDRLAGQDEKLGRCFLGCKVIFTLVLEKYKLYIVLDIVWYNNIYSCLVKN